jgi:hypothetical protein
VAARLKSLSRQQATTCSLVRCLQSKNSKCWKTPRR